MYNVGRQTFHCFSHVGHLLTDVLLSQSLIPQRVEWHGSSFDYKTNTYHLLHSGKFKVVAIRF